MTGVANPGRDRIPPRLGRYEVRAKIGDGGMASVYLGHPIPSPGAPDLPRVVALKVIREEFCQHREFVAMFLDEAKIISRLSHPNLVHVVELGSEGHRYFIAMELLVGQSLWQVWNACRARGVRLRYDVIAWIGARAAEGLHHAHEMKDAEGRSAQLVHRDVNQSNIFLTYDGLVKVIDFGLAKARGRGYETGAGVVKGKIAYLAPEQVSGNPVDRRADVFALGTTLWELATDRRLFRAKTDAETLQRIYSADVPNPATLVQGFPLALWHVLQRALARDAKARYATALEFAGALDTFARSEGRTVASAALADVMRELFSVEYVRDREWLAEASAGDRPAPASTMHPPIATYPPPADAQTIEIVPEPSLPDEVPPSSGWPRGAPPDGMFSPAPAVPAPPRPVAPPSTPPPRDAERAVVRAAPPAPPRRRAASGMAVVAWSILVLGLVLAGVAAAFHFHS